MKRKDWERIKGSEREKTELLSDFIKKHWEGKH